MQKLFKIYFRKYVETVTYFWDCRVHGVCWKWVFYIEIELYIFFGNGGSWYFSIIFVIISDFWFILALPAKLSDYQGRIVGGSQAAVGQFPYIASIRTLGNFHFCGGSIISDRWVITGKVISNLLLCKKIYLNLF